MYSDQSDPYIIGSLPPHAPLHARLVRETFVLAFRSHKARSKLNRHARLVRETFVLAFRSHKVRSKSRLCRGRVSPFGYSRIKARLLAPRDFSQATTSFIACDRQGIHHMHLFA